MALSLRNVVTVRVQNAFSYSFNLLLIESCETFVTQNIFRRDRFAYQLWRLLVVISGWYIAGSLLIVKHATVLFDTIAIIILY